MSLLYVVVLLGSINLPIIDVNNSGEITNADQVLQGVPWGEYDRCCGCQERQIKAWLPMQSAVDLKWKLIHDADNHAFRCEETYNYGEVIVRQFHWHDRPIGENNSIIESCKTTKELKPGMFIP
jgi:hypothetical protein